MKSQGINKKSLLSFTGKFCDNASKVSVVVLFVLMFIGYLNPARISRDINPSVSLVKSAFYFRAYTNDIVELENSAKKAEEEASDSGSEDAGSYDDFYANFEAMAAGSNFGTDGTEFSDDGESLYSTSKDKLTAVKYSKIWASFKSRHPQIASAFEYGRFASILTFIAVAITLLGIYFSFGTKIIRKIGFIISAAGSAFTMFTIMNFKKAYEMLSAPTDMLNVNPVLPVGRIVFVVVSIIVLVFSLAALFMTFVVKAEKEDTEKAQFSAKPFQYTFRILALLIFILLFIPGANPARISENINRNVSLFTSGFSYRTYTENMQRILVRGWLPESVMRLSWISSLFVCLGVIAISAGACMSVGNNKLKRYAHICLGAGSVVSFASLFGILRAYNLISGSPNIDKILPLEPQSIIMFFILIAMILICAAISFLKTPAPEKDEKCKIEAPYQLFLMLLPFLVLVFIFSYLPLWGWRYAFFDYNAGDTLSMDKWVGFKWFKAPFENAATRSDILRVLRNTLAMSGLGIATSWLPMFFAIFLAEIKNTTVRRVVQTLTTIPNFISWVLVYAIAFCIFGTEGFISSLMVNNGIWERGKNMLMGESFIWVKMWLWGTWKGLGWSAIMYIAAISGIDQQLYEAATVDGAGRFQKIWHITIPELFPTYIVLLILSVSNLLSNGMDQYLVFKNPTNKNPIEVLDLYVYNLSFGQTSNSNIPFSTVVSMFKSLVSVVLLFITNKISKWIRGSSIF